MQNDNHPREAQPVSQPISETINPPKSRNLLKIILIFIAVMVIITIAGASILIFSLFNNNTQTSNKKSSQNSPLDNPLILKMAEKLPLPKITMIPITLVPTASISQADQLPISTTGFPAIQHPDWKTYNNTTFNFSIKYPSELTTQEKSHGLGISDISFTNPNSNPQNGPKYQILIYPKTIGNLIGQDFDRLYALPPQSTFLMTSESSTPQQFTKITNAIINGMNALNFRTTSDPPDPTEDAEIGTYIKFGENTLIISTRESNKSDFDFLLSTFKSD